MNGHGKSDMPVVPAKRPNNAGVVPAAEAVEERGMTRGTRTAKRVPDTEPGQARQVRWIVCAR